MREITAATQTSDLVPVFSGVISDTPQQVCSARDLHSFLESGRHFTDWFSSRVTKYGFVENQDFASFSQTGEKLPEGRPATDFQLTLGMAKELGMVENNEKGRQIRRYFIEVEKRQHSTAPAPMTPGQALVEMAQNFLRHETQIAELSRKQHETAAQVMALVNGENYLTVVGWGNLTSQRFDNATASRIGKLASALCRERGYHIGTTLHPAYGRVNTYPREVLDELSATTQD